MPNYKHYVFKLTDGHSRLRRLLVESAPRRRKIDGGARRNDEEAQPSGRKRGLVWCLGAEAKQSTLGYAGQDHREETENEIIALAYQKSLCVDITGWLGEAWDWM